MKRIVLAICLLLICRVCLAQDSGWQGDWASNTQTNTLAFDNNLSAADTDVQKALETLDELAGSGAPTDADYLVGTANGSLSAEIVVGTSPGGELGGSWASPTIDDSLAVTSWNLTTPIFTGLSDFKNGSASAGIFAIYEDSDDGTNNATFTVPALTADTDYTLPPDDGDAGEQLQTNGAGVLTWEAAGAGGGGDSITVDGNAIDTTAAFANTGNVDFTFADGGAGGPDTVTANFVEADPTVDTEAEIEAITGALFGTSKAVTAGYIWVADGTDFESVVMSGEATIASGGAITLNNDALDDQYYDSEADLTGLLDNNYQPLEATLTDIADGTIAEDLVNTANPWATNEIDSSVIISTEIDTWAELMTILTDEADKITHAEITDTDQADTKCFYFEDPTADDDFKSIWANKTANDFLITEIWAESDQTVTFMLQVDDGTPADVDSVDLAPAAGEAEDTSLDGDTTVAAGEELDLAVTSVANTPTWCSICFTGNWVD